MYKIEKNIPLPKVISPGDVLKEMSNGDSIVIPLEKLAGFRNSAKIIGVKLVTSRKGSEDGTVRVWKVSGKRA